MCDISHMSDNLLIEESGKVVFVIGLPENLRDENHRCLVFSSSRRMLDIIQKVMRNRVHRMCRLDGNIHAKEERQKIVNKFTNSMLYTSFLLTTGGSRRWSDVDCS